MKNAPVVFVGGPFKAHVEPATGLLEEGYRRRYERLIAFFEGCGWGVLNAHRTEGWGGAMVSAQSCTERDFRWMQECDLFVAFPGDPASPGTHVEIGWASAMGRPMILMLEPEGEHAALVTGLRGVAKGPVAYIDYGDDEAFLAALGEAAEAIAPRRVAAWPLRPARGADSVDERAQA